MLNRWWVVLGVLSAVVLAGCGGDDDSSTSSEPAGSTAEAAIEDTIKTWLTEGGCDLMTPAFLEDQTFIDEPDRACQQFENLFRKPVFDRDDIVVSDIMVQGTDATAVVGDDGISNVESTYRLRNAGGTWQIDSVDL